MRVKSKLGLRLAAVGVVIGAAGLPIVGFGSASATAAAPVLTATPSTGVSDGVAITVSGTNFPGSNAIILECSGLGTGCQSTPTTATVTSGAFSTSFTPHTGQIGSASSDTCSDGGTCYLVATTDPGDPTDTAAAGFTTITFGGAIKVSPSAGVKSGAQVTVSGSGFPATAESVIVVECSTLTGGQADCDLADVNSTGMTTDTGTFSEKLTVKEGKFGSASCKAAGSCYIVATTDPGAENPDPRQTAVSTVSFAGPPPVVVVSPAKNLKNGSTVTVSGSNFPQHNVPVYILECSSTTKGQAYCDLTGVKIGKTSATGTFKGIKLTIKSSPAFGGKGTCGVGHNCFVVASTSQSGVKADSGFATVSFAKPVVTKIHTSTSAKKVKGGIAGVVKAKGVGLRGFKVTLVLVKGKDSKVVKHDTTGKKGGYAFKVSKAGKYLVLTAGKKVGAKSYLLSESKIITIK